MALPAQALAPGAPVDQHLRVSLAARTVCVGVASVSGEPIMPTPDAHGVVHGLSNEAYHRGPGLSCSGAKRLLRTPYHYWALTQEHDAPPSEPTPQMQNGTRVHCALLEPDQWALRYVVPPGGASDRRTRAYRDFAAWAAERGLQPVTQEETQRAQAQAHALRALPDVARLMARGHAESSAYWTDPLTGVQCKCRPDFVAEGWGDSGAACILLDVKTARDASPEAFARAVASLGYHQQADWYCDGYARATGHEVLGMVFAVVESEYPHAAAAYELDEAALQLGRTLNMRARNLYAQCSQRGAWPSYPRGIVRLSLPAWAWSNHDE